MDNVQAKGKDAVTTKGGRRPVDVDISIRFKWLSVLL